MIVFISVIALQILAVKAIGQDFQQKIAARNPQADSADQSALLCNVVGSLLDICNTAAAQNIQASCLCYSSSTWVPTIFDNAVATCAEYAYSALPKNAYSLASSYEGFCTKVGDISAKNTPLTPTPTTSPIPPATLPTPSPIVPPTPNAPMISTTQIVNPIEYGSPPATPAPTVPSGTKVNIFTNPGCSWISFALSYCNSVTPGFSNITIASQAPCLCYSSTSWLPDSFDKPAKTCADYVRTVDPSFYTDIVAIQNFCTSVGDVFEKGASQTTSTGGEGGIGLNLPGFGVTQVSKSTGVPRITSPANTQSPAKAPIPITTTSTPNEATPRMIVTHCIVALMFLANSIIFAL